jgi:signal peptide peptidase SppA
MAKNVKQTVLSRLLPARFNKSVKVVPLVRLSGVINAAPSLRPGLSLASADKMLERAFSMKGIAAVAIAVNSPGGSPAQSALIHNRIRQLAAENEVPVYAFCEDVAASGGYMLAIAGDEIYGQRFSIIGSIGVVSAGFGFVDAISKLGIERRVYTAGKNKSVLDPFQPEKKQDVERLKKIQLDIHQGFIDMVKARRQAKLPTEEGEIFTGAFWAAPAAKEMGLIDGIGDMHTILREKFGDKVKIKPVPPSGGLSLRRLLSKSDAQFPASLDVNLSGDFAEEFITSLEKRGLWQRFGL